MLKIQHAKQAFANFVAANLALIRKNDHRSLALNVRAIGNVPVNDLSPVKQFEELKRYFLDIKKYQFLSFSKPKSQPQEYPAIWLSKSQPGNIAYYIPGNKDFYLTKSIKKVQSDIDSYFEAKKEALPTSKVSKEKFSPKKEVEEFIAKLNEQKKKIGDPHLPRYIWEGVQARFPDIPVAAHSIVKASNGQALHANRINIAGKNMAIASQYPQAGEMEAYFDALLENRTPVLTVLASQKEMEADAFFDYLNVKGTQVYGDMRVSSTQKQTKQIGNLTLNEYILSVTKLDQNGKKMEAINIPVVHVVNWNDHSAANNTELTQLIEYVDSVKKEKIDFYREHKSRAIGNDNKLLPWIHCHAGVGRTGQMIASMALINQPNLSLEKIITDMRYSRNTAMVQTEKQLNATIALAISLRRDLVSKSNHSIAQRPIELHQSLADSLKNKIYNFYNALPSKWPRQYPPVGKEVGRPLNKDKGQLKELIQDIQRYAELQHIALPKIKELADIKGFAAGPIQELRELIKCLGKDFAHLLTLSHLQFEWGYGRSYQDDDILKVYGVATSDDIKTQSIDGMTFSIVNGKSVMLQQAARGCTAAVSAMLIHDRGGKIDVTDMRNRTLCPIEESVQQDFKKAGFNFKKTSNHTLAELEKSIKKYGPAIASVNSGIGGHVVVVDQVDLVNNVVTIRDPYHGWMVDIRASAFHPEETYLHIV